MSDYALHSNNYLQQKNSDNNYNNWLITTHGFELVQ